MENINNLSVAERYYQKHLLAVHRYEDKNRDLIRKKNAKYYLKIKNEKYDEFLEYYKNHYSINKNDILDIRKIHYINNKVQILEQKKLYYKNVVKPKKLLLKQQQQKLSDIHIFNEILIEPDLSQ